MHSILQASSAFLTPLRIIDGPRGAVLHAMKKRDRGFCGFGEAYFSIVHGGAVKGWKRHRAMTLNLIPVQGEIRVIVRADREDYAAFHLSPGSPATYNRLTVPPGLWVAFGGVGPGVNTLLNVADLEHDPEESETQLLEDLPWCWG